MKNLISNVIDTLMDGDDPNRSLLASITVQEVENFAALATHHETASDSDVA